MQPIQTTRLRLRQWCSDDSQPLADLCADPEVMRYFPSTLSAKEAAGLAKRIQTDTDQYGYSVSVLERRADQAFLGIVGLSYIADGFDFAPCTEIAWRLNRAAWGKGYATEAALAALQYGFEVQGLDNIIAMTAVINKPSERVMQKLGMRYSGNFMHPKLAATDRLCEHVLYQMQAADFSG